VTSKPVVLHRVENHLHSLLRLLEELNGTRTTKLENLVRYAWDEARSEIHRAAEPNVEATS
jgi:hypothetical protein